MRHSSNGLFTAVGLAALSWSCDVVDTDVSQRALGSGATITSERFPMTIQSGDPARHLFVSTGVAAEHATEVCLGGLLDEWVDPMDFRAVETPSGGVVLRLEGDVHTLVYASERDWAFTNDFGSFYDAFCEAILTSEPIATGISHAMFSDSFGRQGDHWGLKAAGQLIDRSGAPVSFVHAGACGIPDWDTGTLRCNVQVNLH